MDNENKLIEALAMKLDRVYSVFAIKSLNERIIEGLATTIDTDRQGDIVVPSGGNFILPLPLFFSTMLASR